MGDVMNTARKLYDLAGANEGLRFSPYCWRIKLALAHKNLPFETVAWRFTDKDEIAFAGTGKVPVLVDGKTVIHDSQEIAEYLETQYSNEPSLFGDATQRALTRFVKEWAESTLHPAIGRLVVPDIFAALHEKDKAYFRETREKMFGMTIDELKAKRESFAPGFAAALVPLRRTLQVQPFICGPGPGYADHIVFGALQWGRKTSAVPLLEEDDVISVWMATLLETYGIE
jgi:glutathione S-transferase